MATLSAAQRIGQLFMVGESLPSPDEATRQALKDQAVGGVVLYGDSHAPVASIRSLTDALRAVAKTATPPVGLYISTDQEGGQIQQLTGSGFEAMPTALVQGKTDPRQLETKARVWGNQLAQAGVNVDLAPVLDVVPPSFIASNQPIAHYERQLGDDQATVAAHGAALVHGIQAAAVSATVKHFPGLGRVVGNTDTSANVVDSTTTRHDPLLAPFAAGIRAGTNFVMISLATYQRIDAEHRAVFSSIVIKDILRGDLGFRGIVVSDDLGSAQQVAGVAPGARAVDFLTAGGTIVLVVKPPSAIGPMIAAVQAQAAASLEFREVLDIDILAVLTAKYAAGLVACP